MFTLTLPRNFRKQQIADFGPIQGLPGVYMANQLAAGVFDDPHSGQFRDYAAYLQSKVAQTDMPP